MWTYANNSRSLNCEPARQGWLSNIAVKRMYAVAECRSTLVSSGSYRDNVRASVNDVTQAQRYCTNKVDDKSEVTKESPPGLLRRFHQTYKEHGKILVCVHLVTSAVWASIFYCAAVRYVLRHVC